MHDPFRTLTNLNSAKVGQTVKSSIQIVAGRVATKISMLLAVAHALSA